MRLLTNDKLITSNRRYFTHRQTQVFGTFLRGARDNLFVQTIRHFILALIAHFREIFFCNDKTRENVIDKRRGA